MAPEALCFDMYGTLCDTSSVRERLGEALSLPAGVARGVDELWRQKQLQYSFQRGQMDDYATFRQVTADALDYALAYDGHDPDETTRERVLTAYDHLDPFPDALDALARLSEDYTVTVLSNGNPEMLATLAENTGIEAHLDDVISADEVSTFKPAPAVYENAAARLDRDIDECRLVSSNAWDVAGAARAGMKTAWVNRRRDPFERVGGTPDVEVASLAALADRL